MTLRPLTRCRASVFFYLLTARLGACARVRITPETPPCSFAPQHHAQPNQKTKCHHHHHHHHQPESYSGCCGPPPSVMRTDLVPHGSSITHIGPSNHHASLECGVDSYRLDTEVIRSSGKSMRWSRLGSINVHWPRSMPLGMASIRTHTL